MLKIKPISLILLCLVGLFLPAQLKICSWNIANFGKSKTDEQIAQMAKIIKDYDVVAIQEVVAGPGGAQAVARLADILNRGNRWDYQISNPTSGDNPYTRERYAFLWKSNIVQKKQAAFLEPSHHNEIEREPYVALFSYKNKPFYVFNFHAIPKSKQPETEIKYFKFFLPNYQATPMVVLGDFNCPHQHSVFNPWAKLGLQAALIGQKTSLKQNCYLGDDCTASAYDNIWFSAGNIRLRSSQVLHHYRQGDFQQAHALSDHLPVVVEIEWP
jgi:deoxyribonuclease-1-like protein